MHTGNLCQLRTEQHYVPWESSDGEITLNDIQLMQFE